MSKPSRFAATTVKLRNKLQDHTGEIQEAKAAEIKQVFEELNALEPVERKDIPPGIKPLGCHLFTVQKFDASGEHDKYKSRLVWHGNEQDTSLYPDRSSPTVSVHAIMTCLALAACNSSYIMAKIDVKGAFIQTERRGTPVYIRCTGGLKTQILQMYPKYSKYVGTDGVLYCKLKKALYGCVQASKLWYEKLKLFLIEQGYVHGDIDPCMFRWVVDGKVYLLLVYIDDILLIGDEREVNCMEKEFLKEFRWITMSKGRSHSYIGMQLTVRDIAVTLDMKYYLECILKNHSDLKVVATPGGKNGFMVNAEAGKLK
jgi:hypothetical protein